MRRIFLCLAIIAALAAFSVYGTLYVGGISERIIEGLDEVCGAEGEEAVSAARETDRLWNEFYEKHIFITDKEHAMEITALLARIAALAEEGSDELTAECRTAKKLVQLFCEKQKPELMNVL